MKHLYEIETNLILYVVAESTDQARSIGLRHIKDEADNVMKFDLDATEDPEYIDINWIKSEPYGDDFGEGLRTVEEIHLAIQDRIKKEADYKEYCNKQLHLFPANEDFNNRPEIKNGI